MKSQQQQPSKLANPPLTPNLEEYKQKNNKSKSRRKPNTIQPTFPPTPKLPHKAQIVIKPNINKFGEAMRGKQDLNNCCNHPDRTATHIMDNTNKRLCNKCFILFSRGDDETDEQIQIQKRRELDEFKGKIKGFGLKLEQASSSYEDWTRRSQKTFYTQKDYITDTFQSIKNLVEQKKRELINELMKKQQGVMKSLDTKNQVLSEIKGSISRYVEDIDNNYDEIIESLSYRQFIQIIERYNQKIQYFEEKLQDIVFDATVNVYIPTTEIKKFIQISEVQMYPFELEETNSFKNKTLQRYTTEKNNLLADYQFPQHYQAHPQHLESLSNKLSQQRGSRDRYELSSKDVSINQMRNHTNKQNGYYDNVIYR